MAKSFVEISGLSASMNDSLTRYWPIAQTVNGNLNGTESQTHIRWTTPGTFSNLSVYVSANSIDDNNSIVAFRKNAADGNQIVTVTAATTGFFEDVTNTDTISAGDELAFRMTSGNDTAAVAITWGLSSVYFDATSGDTAVMFASYSAGQVITDGLTRDSILVGSQEGQGTQTNIFNQFNTAGTLQNMYVYIPTNATTGSSTIQSYNRNVGAGNIIVTIAAGTTGEFADTSNTDTISVNEDWAYRRINGGGGSITVAITAFEFVTTDDSWVILGGRCSGAPSVLTSVTNYYALNTNPNSPQTTEANSQHKVKENYTFSNLWLNLPSNTVTASSTFFFRVNGADSAMGFTIPASTTGEFEDTSNTVSPAIDDLLNIRLTTGATGTQMALYGSSIKVQGPTGTTFIPIVSFF